jgi:hypothetical protein
MRLFDFTPEPGINGQFAPDTVVSLSPYGRAVYERAVQLCSYIAGRNVTFDEIYEIRCRMQTEPGDEMDFFDPEVFAKFCRLLRGSAD